MKLVKVVYIASPYSHYSQEIKDCREMRVNEVSAKLHKQYEHAFIMPIAQSAQMKRMEPSLGTSFEYWRDRDLTFISVSDEVWVIKIAGWNDSLGVLAEIEFAGIMEKPVRYLDPFTLQFDKE